MPGSDPVQRTHVVVAATAGVAGTAGGSRSGRRGRRRGSGRRRGCRPRSPGGSAASSSGLRSRGRRTSMPNGVPRAASGSSASPTLATRTRYGSNSGPWTATSPSASKTGSAHSRAAERLRQAANAAAPRDPAVITPSHSRIASRTGCPAGRAPGPGSSRTRQRGARERVAEDGLEVGAVRPVRPRSSSWIRAARCGGANSLPSSSLSLPASLVGRDDLAVGRHVVARQLDPARPGVRRPRPGTMPRRLSSSRAGTRPALRYRTAPLRSAMTMLLTGRHPARRRRASTSSTSAPAAAAAAPRSRARRARSGRADREPGPPVPVARRTAAPGRWRSTSTVTGPAPRTSMVSSRPSTTSSSDSSYTSW